MATQDSKSIHPTSTSANPTGGPTGGPQIADLKTALPSDSPKSPNAQVEGGSQQDTQVPRSSRVYVSNLSFTTTWQELKDHMRTRIGPVIRVDLITHPSGQSKGCAIVEFENVELAERAITELNSTELAGRKMFIREDREQKDWFKRNQLKHQLNQQIAMQRGMLGLPILTPSPGPQETAGRGSYHSLPQFGPTSPQGHALLTGPSNAYTFNPQVLQSLSMQGMSLMPMGRGGVFSLPYYNVYTPPPRFMNQPLSLSAPQHQQRSQPTLSQDVKSETGSQAFIGNIPFACSWQDVAKLFTPYGEVLRVDLVHDKLTGKSRGFGTVKFSKAIEAEAAIKALNNTEWMSRILRVHLDQWAE